MTPPEAPAEQPADASPSQSPSQGQQKRPADTSLYDREVKSLDDAAETDATPCPVCRGGRVVPRFEVSGIASPIVVCTSCGHGRFHPMLAKDEVRTLYPKHYYGEPGTKFRSVIERGVRTVAARHIGFLSSGLEEGAAILDVGCGRGVLFGPLADRGFRVVGVEVSEDAVQGCDPRAELHIGDELADAKFESASFDQIVIWHVLEHLADPRGTILECQRILKPGGRLIVAVPNFSSLQARWSGPDWFHLDLPRHLHHFTYSGLCQLIEGAGFDVSSSHHFSLRQNPFGWVQSALNRWSRQPTGGLYTLLHQRRSGHAPLFGARTRLAMWLAFAAMAPFAIALSMLAAWLRSGATVHVVALRRD